MTISKETWLENRNKTQTLKLELAAVPGAVLPPSIEYTIAVNIDMEAIRKRVPNDAFGTLSSSNMSQGRFAPADDAQHVIDCETFVDSTTHMDVDI